MVRRRLDAWLELDATDPLQTEVVGEINTLRMVFHVFYTAERRRDFFPATDPVIELAEIGLQILVEIRLILGKAACQSGSNVLSGDFPVGRVQKIMCIPLGRQAPLGAIKPRGSFQNWNADRTI